MGDKTLAMAKLELEELYLGIPDESVNLTFQDLAKLNSSPDKKSSKMNTATAPTCIATSTSTSTSSLHKSPSLDFHRALNNDTKNDHHLQHHLHHLDFDRAIMQASPFHHHSHNHYLNHDGDQAMMHASPFHHHGRDHHQLHHGGDQAMIHASPFHQPARHHHHHHRGDDHQNHRISPEMRRGETERSVAYDDDDVSALSMAAAYLDRGQKRRRPGIPHSNICTVCSSYIYIFRHRCLVCGRVYCRNCVSVGMGEMTEGRKCIQCLGKRFSQRYIKEASKVGCCLRYPSAVKQAELKWAEKGPRRSGERAYGCGNGSTVMSMSRSPVTPIRAPTSPHAIADSSPSFVAASPFSPYTPKHHHLPL